MKSGDFIAREGETFMLQTGVYEDVVPHGPFLATRDLPAQETAEAFATWLTAVGYGGAVELIRDMNADPDFRQARFGAECCDPTSAAMAAWLFNEGAAIPKPCPVVKVATLVSESNSNFSVLLSDLKSSGSDFVKGSAQVEVAPAPGR